MENVIKNKLMEELKILELLPANHKIYYLIAKLIYGMFKIGMIVVALSLGVDTFSIIKMLLI